MDRRMIIALGLGLLLFGAVYPLVTVIVDDTPPTFKSTYPEQGKTYSSLAQVRATIEDLESGVEEDSVRARVDTGEWINLYLDSGNAYTGTYEELLNTPVTSSGNHAVTFTATNYAGLAETKVVNFVIYTALQGTWSVNGQVITDPTQTIYVTNRTLTFEFVKTAGVEDSKISCRVEEGGATVVQLSRVAAGRWRGSATVPAGSHTYEMVADDGTTTVVMSIIDVGVGTVGGFKISPRLVILLCGGVVLAYGWMRR